MRPFLVYVTVMVVVVVVLVVCGYNSINFPVWLIRTRSRGALLHNQFANLCNTIN